MAFVNQRLFVAEESAFSVDPSADGSSYQECYVEGLSVALAQESIARPVHRPTHAKIPNVAGVQSPTVGFSAEALGLATPAGSVAAVPVAWLSTLMQSACLAETLGTGSEVSGSSATTTELPLLDASGIAVGTMVLVEIGGEQYARMVIGKSTDTITVDPALPSAPPDEAKVFASATYTPDDLTQPGTCSFVRKGADGFEHTVTGARGNVSLSVEAGQRAMLAFEFSANAHETSTKASLPAVAKPTKLPVLGKCATLMWGDAEVIAASVEFNAGAELAAFESPNGCSGRTAWNVNERNPSMTFSPLYSSAYETDFASDTERAALLQVGTEAGRCIAVYIRRAQIVSAPSPEDVNGVAGQSLEIRANQPDAATLPVFAIGVF